MSISARRARRAKKAVQFALKEESDGSVTIHRTDHPTGDYAAEFQFTALEELAGKTRHMPDEFIADSGSHVTEAFRRYLAPLLGSGMPDMQRLHSHPVAKISL